MRYFPLFYLFFTTIALQAQTPALIEYAAVTSFHWGLFQGKINKDHLQQMGESTGAVTVSSISYTSQQTSPTDATVSITARFHTQESWTRYPNLNQPDEALNHERRHFEITEIYARKLRQAVSQAKFSSRHFSKELDRLFNEYAGQHRAEQVRYDHETRHSIEIENQREWDQKIDQWLKELEAYAGTDQKVRLN